MEPWPPPNTSESDPGREKARDNNDRKIIIEGRADGLQRDKRFESQLAWLWSVEAMMPIINIKDRPSKDMLKYDYFWTQERFWPQYTQLAPTGTKSCHQNRDYIDSLSRSAEIPPDRA